MSNVSFGRRGRGLGGAEAIVVEADFDDKEMAMTKRSI